MSLATRCIFRIIFLLLFILLLLLFFPKETTGYQVEPENKTESTEPLRGFLISLNTYGHRN